MSRVSAFILIPVLLAVALVWGVAVAWARSGAARATTVRVSVTTSIAAVVWMAATWVAAQSGVLRKWDQAPPPFAILVVAIVVLAIMIAYGRVGQQIARYLPLWALVAVQAFRLPLELAMHELTERGIMPEQMTYTGRNFDIVTGATAILVAWAVASGRGGPRLVIAWNLLGLALLVNVVTIAMLSTPAIRYFGDDRLNVFVTYPPYVWLPAVMVLAALAGHLLIFRAVGFYVRR